MKKDYIGKYYEELPLDYIKCKDINNFLSIDLREQSYRLLNNINYLVYTMNKYYLYNTFTMECTKLNNIKIGNLKRHIDMGVIYIELQPLYITLQTNNDIQDNLIEKRFKDFVIKAHKGNQIQVKEGLAAFDFKFNYPPYLIHVFKKMGKSTLIFHNIIEGIYDRTKDDTYYVIEHIIKSITLK